MIKSWFVLKTKENQFIQLKGADDFNEIGSLKAEHYKLLPPFSLFFDKNQSFHKVISNNLFLLTPHIYSATRFLNEADCSLFQQWVESLEVKEIVVEIDLVDAYYSNMYFELIKTHNFPEYLDNNINSSKFFIDIKRKEDALLFLSSIRDKKTNQVLVFFKHNNFIKEIEDKFFKAVETFYQIEDKDVDFFRSDVVSFYLQLKKEAALIDLELS